MTGGFGAERHDRLILDDAPPDRAPVEADDEQVERTWADLLTGCCWLEADRWPSTLIDPATCARLGVE